MRLVKRGILIGRSYVDDLCLGTDPNEHFYFVEEKEGWERVQPTFFERVIARILPKKVLGFR